MEEVNMDEAPEAAPADLRGRLLHAMRGAMSSAARHNAAKERMPIDPVEAALDAALAELGLELREKSPS